MAAANLSPNRLPNPLALNAISCYIVDMKYQSFRRDLLLAGLLLARSYRRLGGYRY